MDMEEIQVRQKLIEHSEGAGAESGTCFWLAEIAAQLAELNANYDFYEKRKEWQR